MSYAVRKDGLGWRAVDSKADLLEGETFSETAPILFNFIVPEVITMRQARLQLLSLGLLDDVETTIANIEDLTIKKTIQIEWEYAKDVERNSPTILLLAQSVGMDEVALDNLFIEAVKL